MPGATGTVNRVSLWAGAFMRPIIYTVHGACTSRQDKLRGAGSAARSSRIRRQVQKAFQRLGQVAQAGATVAQDGKTYNRNTHTNTAANKVGASTLDAVLSLSAERGFPLPSSQATATAAARAPNTSIEEATMNLSRRVR